MRRRFTEGNWTRAEKPRFTVWLTKNDFFEITLHADTGKMVGTVKTTRSVNNGSSAVELVPRMQITEPFSDEEEAVALIEAYLKRDGTFDTLVQWADGETRSGQP